MRSNRIQSSHALAVIGTNCILAIRARITAVTVTAFVIVFADLAVSKVTSGAEAFIASVCIGAEGSSAVSTKDKSCGRIVTTLAVGRTNVAFVNVIAVDAGAFIAKVAVACEATNGIFACGLNCTVVAELNSRTFSWLIIDCGCCYCGRR